MISAITGLLSSGNRPELQAKDRNGVSHPIRVISEEQAAKEARENFKQKVLEIEHQKKCPQSPKSNPVNNVWVFIFQSKK